MWVPHVYHVNNLIDFWTETDDMNYLWAPVLTLKTTNDTKNTQPDSLINLMEVLQ